MPQTERNFTLTIPDGAQNSNAHGFGSTGYRSPVTMTFISPATLPETVNVEIAGPLGNFVTYQSDGVDIVLGARKGATIVISTAMDIRVRATGPVGGARAFEVLWNVIGERG